MPITHDPTGAATDLINRRVLLVASNFPRWHGDTTTPFVWHLAQDLQVLGWQVDVLAPHAPGAARQEVLGGINVERFRYLWPETQQSVCYQGGALVNLRLRPSNHLKLPPLLVAEFVALIHRLKTRRYAILNSHWILPQGFIGSLARQFIPGPHIITAHGGDVFALRSAPLRAAKGWAIAHADAITVNSSATESEVRRIAGSTSIHRIPLGVISAQPTEAQHAQSQQLRRQECTKDQHLLLFVGRLVDEKGVADLLEAMVQLKASRVDVRALIVGDGQERERLQRLCSRLGLSHQTSFKGWIDSQELPSYYLAADIFVAPSRSAPNGWIEAQGLSVQEAMAAGLPVVATACGGIVDSIQDSESGLLVPERDPAALAQAIQRLIQSRALRSRLGEKARITALKSFTRPASAGAFDRLFRSILTERARSRANPCPEHC